MLEIVKLLEVDVEVVIVSVLHTVVIGLTVLIVQTAFLNVDLDVVATVIFVETYKL